MAQKINLNRNIDAIYEDFDLTARYRKRYYGK
jgi:hypothetical protein